MSISYEIEKRFKSEDFKSIQAKDIQDFFQKFKDKNIEIKFKVQTISNPGYDKLNSFFEKFKNYTYEIPVKLKTEPVFNVWKAAGIKHLEVQNCNVLAALFNSEITDGFGRDLLACICNILGKNEIAKKLRNKIKYRVNTEPPTSKNKRIDISIEAHDFIIFFEVKIGHYEDKKQIQEYYCDLKKTYDYIDVKNKLLIFLTLNGSKSSYFKYSKDKNKIVKSLSWNLLMLEIETLLHEYQLYTKFKNDTLANYISQYLQHTKQYFIG